MKPCLIGSCIRLSCRERCHPVITMLFVEFGDTALAVGCIGSLILILERAQLNYLGNLQYSAKHACYHVKRVCLTETALIAVLIAVLIAACTYDEDYIYLTTNECL